ncbi:MAG: hypothetical protein GF350_01110 [Chitinivibrionales bacterium]|nr:hypothetical protein [Chitinivibrionales bacterium]
MKKTAVLILLTASLYAGGLKDLQLSGYAENMTSLVAAEDESISDIALLRLEASWDYKTYGGIETHLIVSAPLTPLDPSVGIREGSVMDRLFVDIEKSLIGMINGYMPQLEIPEDMDSTEYFSLMEQQAAAQEQAVEELISYMPYSSLYPRDKFILDRAMIKLYFRHFDLFIGRQMIAWGTGYAFNPTDAWNSKNPFDPEAPKIGVNALRAEIPFGALSGLSLVVSPGADFNHTAGGVRWKTNIARFDLSLCGMRIMTADREIYSLFAESVPSVFTKRSLVPEKLIAGLDFAGQIGEIGVWGETAFNNPVYSGMEYYDLDSLYIQAVAGGDYTFENGLYTMAEYYYNGLGKGDHNEYGAIDLVNLFAGEMAGFGRHYLMTGGNFTLGDRFPAGLFALGNLADISVILIPSIGYEFGDNITCKLSCRIGAGDQAKSEYGGIHPNVIFLVRGYF